jgi:uncharacterized protein (DUF488 family)
MPAPAYDLFTIGHSNIAADRFIAVLRQTGVDTVADVRSVPASRRFPWFSASRLRERLARERIAYEMFGEQLGGRPRDSALYRDGVADYEAMAAQPEFRAGLERLSALARHRRVCLMCAEREPLDCHRCLLVGRALAEHGCAIGHILHDGSLEPHTETERRLVEITKAGDDLFATGQAERLAAAYRCRARAVAYHAKT